MNNYEINYFDINHDVVIYPNDKGWIKIKKLITKKYLLSHDECEKWIDLRRSECGGYKDQLWSIISDLNDIYYNGQEYLMTTTIKLIRE